MAAKDVADWLASDAVIDPLTHPMGHGMKFTGIHSGCGNYNQSMTGCCGTVDCTTLNGVWLDCRPMACSTRLMAAYVVVDGFYTYIPSAVRRDDDHADRFCCYHEIAVWRTDLDATRQFNWGAIALSYLYYRMDLCIRGAHLKLLNGSSWNRIEKYPWGDVADFPILQRGKGVRRGSEPRAPDTTVVISMLEHRPGALFSFILDYTGQTAQGLLEMHLVSSYQMSPPGCTHMSIDDYNEVIIDEAEESSGDDLEETTSNMS
ncbi:hypothetical protein JCGZ_11279 [Jatropha curcas]|uniref:Uncharacterized protein n=1 Tax=Jatropha curcas TaxID=180498 RepID=A0A067KID0_JATCU|nr:hypothetical protein JCGZ_11279 [Jatropha curcas]